jgi:hypothetical protein
MNPYRHDTLLNGMLGQEDRFIGLRDELEWVLGRVSEPRPSAVSLVGPVGVGKSFLVAYLAHAQGARRNKTFQHAIGERFNNDPDRLLFVAPDIADADIGRRAQADLIGLLYDYMLCKLAELLALDDARLIPLDRIADAHIPTVAALRALVKQQIARAREEADDDELRERFAAALGPRPLDALLALLGRLDAWGLRVIFLIDDFDTITSALKRADFDHLRALLAAASLVIVTRKALSKLVPADVQTSPFFNLVQRLDLRSLYFWPAEEARRMITEPPKWLASQFQFSTSDADFILELTGQHPDLIRIVCEALYMRYRRRAHTAGSDVLPAEERMLLRAQLGTLFADSFASLWHHLPEEQRAMLQQIATNRVTVDDTLTSPLNAVINLGYIVCEKGRYKLFSGLFLDYVIEKTGATPNPAPAPVKAQLTDLEQKLLSILAAQQGATVERDEIIAMLYDARPAESDLRTYDSRLDALIFRLRGKLDSEPQQIESIRGQGYRLVTTK